MQKKNFTVKNESIIYYSYFLEILESRKKKIQYR